MRPSATYRGARRAEAKRARKKTRGKFRTVSVAMISFRDIMKINALRLRTKEQRIAAG